MKQTRRTELTVGVFMLIGLAALLFLALEVANVTSLGAQQQYQILARFDNVGSLKVRSPVKVGGVVIGQVSAIELDSESYVPVVTMDIDSRFDRFTDTSSVEILTSGLIGEQYIRLVPGFELDDTEYLRQGDFVADTKSAIVLEDLIGQFLYNVQGE